MLLTIAREVASGAGDATTSLQAAEPRCADQDEATVAQPNRTQHPPQLVLAGHFSQQRFQVPCVRTGCRQLIDQTKRRVCPVEQISFGGTVAWGGANHPKFMKNVADGK